MRFLYQVTRPVQVIAAFLATWVSAALSQAPGEIPVYAASAMAVGTLGASLFHFGAAHKMYSRKTEVVKVKYPALLVVSGLSAFAISIAISEWMLRRGSVLILFFNVLVITHYANTLSKWWPTKNGTIAIVCTTPLILGWWVGAITHPATPLLLFTVFTAYWAREIVKDVEDKEANEGYRLTLPIELSPTKARWIAGGVLAVSTLCATGLIKYGWQIASPVLILAMGTFFLLAGAEESLVKRVITIGMFTLIAAFGL